MITTTTAIRWISILGKICEQGIHTLLLDSYRRGNARYSLLERALNREIEKLFKQIRADELLSALSLLLIPAKLSKSPKNPNRKIFISGLSMKTNIQIARISVLENKKETIISVDEINKYHDDKFDSFMPWCAGRIPNAQLDENCQWRP